MADGDDRHRDSIDAEQRKASKGAGPTGDLHKDPGERKSIISKKSLLSMQEQDDSVQRKPIVKNSDMNDEMQQFAIDCALQALDTEDCNTERDIASYIRSEFEKKYNPNWHCIVGRNFGSFVSHERKHFTYFYLGQLGILLFKSG